MIKDIIDANKSVNATQIKIEKLKELFPGAFHGDTIDFEYIKSALKEVKVTKEGFELNFLGKSYSKLLAALDTETVIVPDLKHNEDDENKNSKNLYISADNLDALKHLLKSYWRKAKMIYIDPPYNTGSDGFVYNDNFNFSKQDLIEKLGLDEEQADHTLNLIQSNSSSHSAWLTFMYPRLYLAKQLLREDGVLFMSIDDNELANAKLICDDLFGESNFLGVITWLKKRKGSFLSKTLQSLTEYILAYSINPELVTLYGGQPNAEESQPIIKRTNKISTLEFNAGIIKTRLPDGTYEAGTYGEEVNPVVLEIPAIVKNGVITNKIRITAPFTWSQAFLNGELEKGTTVVINTTNFQPRVFRNLDENKFKALPSIIYGTELKATNEDAYEELNKIFGVKNIFSYSKPTNLIKHLINAVSHFDKNCLVVDFFSGSGTTAQAVLEQNIEDNGNRQFILVQLPEETPTDSEAYIAGFKTINQIGIDRIKRVASDLKKQHILKMDNNILFLDEIRNSDTVDFGFKHFEVNKVQSNKLTLLETFNPDTLFVDRGILDEFGVDTILTTWINQDGYGLSRTWKELKLDSYVAYQIENTLYLINPEITNEAIKELLEKFELDSFICNKIILFGYSFTMSEIQSIKDNLKQVEGIRHITMDIMVRY